jgi:hypothetical protein
MPAVDIPEPRHLELSEIGCELLGIPPLYAGEFIQWRFQFLVDGEAHSLEGADLAFVARESDNAGAAVAFSRTSFTQIADWSPATFGIVADADQTTEDEENGTGKGWYTITWTPADETTLLGKVGRWPFDVRAEFADGKIRTLLRGRVYVYRSRTLRAQL